MVENELMRALRDFIGETVAEMGLPTRGGEERAPKIVNSYLPPKRSGPDDDFPFVVVRPDSGETTREETVVDVSIIVGCYSEDVDGHEWCFNVMTRIRDALAALPFGTLAQRYQLRAPLRWENLDDQPYPHWQVNLTTKWAFRAPAVPF